MKRAKQLTREECIDGILSNSALPPDCELMQLARKKLAPLSTSTLQLLLRIWQQKEADIINKSA